VNESREILLAIGKIVRDRKIPQEAANFWAIAGTNRCQPG